MRKSLQHRYIPHKEKHPRCEKYKKTELPKMYIIKCTSDLYSLFFIGWNYAYKGYLSDAKVWFGNPPNLKNSDLRKVKQYYNCTMQIINLNSPKNPFFIKPYTKEEIEKGRLGKFHYWNYRVGIKCDINEPKF